MAYLCVDKDGTEWICATEPHRNHQWFEAYTDNSIWVCEEQIYLPKGSIAKLIGRELTWEDEPVEI